MIVSVCIHSISTSVSNANRISFVSRISVKIARVPTASMNFINLYYTTRSLYLFEILPLGVTYFAYFINCDKSLGDKINYFLKDE